MSAGARLGVIRGLGSALALFAWAATTPVGTQAQVQAEAQAQAQAFLQAEPAGPKFGYAWIRKARELRAAAAAPPSPPPGTYALAGTFNVAILAATYSDVVPRYDATAYREVFFGEVPDDRYSLREFYLEASGGAFGFQGELTPWIRLDKLWGYYLEGRDVNGRGRYLEYMHDVLLRADTLVDWRRYDNDGPDGIPDSGDDDGFVDMVVFLHPLADGICGSGEAFGPTATGYRLSRGGGPFQGRPFQTGTVGASGLPLLVEDFVLAAGLHCNTTDISTTNITIHEMGHALGLPDLYDRDGSTFGVGVWDVMGTGVYATPRHPSQLGAWSRRQLGWVTVTEVGQGEDVTLGPVIRGRRVARVDIPGTQEYFLLENRQRLLADDGLPGEGMVVWRVDDEVLIPLLNLYQGADDDDHPGLAVLQADGQQNLRTRSNPGDAGDPFPGSAGVHVLSDSTEVNLRGYDGDLSFVRLTGIAQSDENVSFHVEVAYPPLTLQAGQELPGGVLGEVAYEAPIAVEGGAGTRTFRALEGVPQGMGLRSDGRLRGAPRAIGESVIRFEVTDDVGQSATGEATFSVSMPDVTRAAAVDWVLRAASLDSTERRALDLAGNQNGRLDVGDLWLVVTKELVR